MQHIKDFNVSSKRTVVRCDFNVPMDDSGNILDTYRIERSLKTLEYLLEHKAKVIILSHLSPEDKKKEGTLPSLRPVAGALGKILNRNVNFSDNCIGGEAVRQALALQDSDILLMENLRHHPEEEKNDRGFAKNLAALGDVYINDAFGVSHRAHASVSAITEFLPSYAGFLLDEEVNTITQVLQNPQRPLVAIIGGAKLSTKIKVIENLLQKADHVIIGGNIANIIVQAKGLMVSGATVGEDVRALADRIDITNPKLHLPVDGVACLDPENEDYARNASLGSVRKEEKLYDIGVESIKLFQEVIAQAKTVFYNGPLGYIEKPRFENGTFEIARAIASCGAFTVTGGGETNAFLKKYGLIGKFSYVSTGGGAMLSLVDGQNLPGLEALGYYAK